MAEAWQTNDSARAMMHKYNLGVDELNKLAAALFAINDRYTTLEPSEFTIGTELEAAHEEP